VLFNGMKSPIIAPPHRGSGPPSNTWLLGPTTRHMPSRSSQPFFSPPMVQVPYTLLWDGPFPPQNCPNSHFCSAYKWGIRYPHFKKWGYAYPSYHLKLRPGFMIIPLGHPDPHLIHGYYSRFATIHPRDQRQTDRP